MTTSLKALTDQAGALKNQGKRYEAIDLYAKAVRLYPGSAVAEHNLAAGLGDVGRASDAETHIRRAFAKGLKAPESWLVLARALVAQGKIDEARGAFDKTISLSPEMIVAHYERAQLIWMSTADPAAAIRPLDESIQSNPDLAGLIGTKARVLMYTAGAATTYDFVRESLLRWPDDVKLLGNGVEAATLMGELDAALLWSDRLIALCPDSVAARDMRMYALLASGRAAEVMEIAESILKTDPLNQHAWAMVATAARILGDARYEQLYNYDEFVRPYTLTPPRGWESLDEYLRDLGAALLARHPFKTHPFSNSEEHGSKISDVLEMDEPALKAFSEAIRPAVDAHLNYLGRGADILRKRNTGQWQIDGIWSVRLPPGGYHHDHVHPAGWLSSACYVELPERVESGSQEGWIKFGEPGPVTQPELPYEHAVKPEPGMLVLFPSYMWHGTIPFGGDEPRLTVAFDIVPG